MRIPLESGRFAYAIFKVRVSSDGLVMDWEESPSFPAGFTHDTLIMDSRVYNQAIHKDVLCAQTGEVVEPPIIRRQVQKPTQT